METFWSIDQLEVIDDMVGSGRTGSPRQLVLTGEAGTGKTTYLSRLTTSADDYVVLDAEGVRGLQAPYDVLAQWGAHVESTDGTVPPPFVAAQALRDVLDRHRSRAPVLLKVDNLQWADAESIEALAWLLRRVNGDRLIVAVGTRPLPENMHPGWQRYSAHSTNTTQVDLKGMTHETAARLTQSRHPELPEAVGTRLWEHTGGNPLYLTALMDEYDPAHLRDLDALPAPSAFAQSVRIRLGRLPEPCLKMLRTISVLGPGWVTMADVTAVSRFRAPSEVAELLRSAALLEIRLDAGQPTMRASHSLVAAAVYQQMPLGTRREYHLAAASVAGSERVALRHRVAAAESYDHDLAEDLHHFATQLHDQRSHWVAAQYMRWASSITADPRLRRRRWLESLFDSVLADDNGRVDAAIAEFESAEESELVAVIRGLLAGRAGHWDDALSLLEPVVSSPTANVDGVILYRANVLAAWAGVMSTGISAATVRSWLSAATVLDAHDESLSSYVHFAGGLLHAREVGPAVLLQQLANLPERSQSVPPAQTDLLSWRGGLRSYLGLHALARNDLVEAQRRIKAGVFDVSGGAFQGLQLAHIFWFTGDWELAGPYMRLAEERSHDFSVASLVLANQPLIPIGFGDLELADTQIETATAALDVDPWPESVQALLIARTVRAHAGPDTRDSQLWGQMAAKYPTVSLTTGLVGPTFYMHAALAALWASDMTAFDVLMSNMASTEPQADWVSGVLWWLRALRAEANGESETALSALDNALSGSLDKLPLYHAHTLIDFARIAHAGGRTRKAQDAVDRATVIYLGLGAVGYVERAQNLFSWAQVPPRQPSWSVPLSDRERDVLSLVVHGMSYSQVAKELFITQSTVSYHLSNIYPKAGVRSRHELTALARTNPATLGLASAASR